MLLALDLATVTGAAYMLRSDFVAMTPLEEAMHEREGTNVPAPRSFSERLSAKGSSLGRFMVDCENWHNRTLERIQPKIVVFESPINFPGRGASTKDTIRKAVGNATMLEKVCYERHIQVYEVNLSSVTKHFTGYGRHANSKVRKKAMIEAARRKGWRPVDDNAADALGILSYAMLLLKE